MTSARKPAARPGRPSMSGECRARLDQVFAWLDGELRPAEARAVERHVTTCESCGGLAEDLRRAIAACRAAGDCRVPTSVHRLARARARALIGANAERPLRRRG